MIKYFLIPSVAVQIKSLDILNTIKNLFQNENVIDEFQSLLCEMIGYKHSILFPSATLALKELLHELARYSTKREVIIPAYTCPSVYYTVINSGLISVLVDINMETLAIDIQKLDLLTSQETLAVIVAHMFGKTANVKEIRNVIKNDDIILIEDMAQALDNYSETNNSNVCLGDYCLLSFAKAKCVSTIEGGAILTDNAATINNLNLVSGNYPPLTFNKRIFFWIKLLLYSIAVNPYIYYWIDRFSIKNKNEDPYKIKNVLKLLRRKYQFSKLQASLGIEMIKKIPKLNAIRTFNGKLFDTVNNDNYIKLNNKDNIYFRFVIICKEKAIRADIMKKLYANGVKASTADFPLLSILKPRSKNYKDKFEVAENVANNILTLPTHTNFKEKEIKSILNVLSSI